MSVFRDAEEREWAFKRSHAVVIVREEGQPPRKIETGPSMRSTLDLDKNTIKYTTIYEDGTEVAMVFNDETIHSLIERFKGMADRLK